MKVIGKFKWNFGYTLAVILLCLIAQIVYYQVYIPSLDRTLEQVTMLVTKTERVTYGWQSHKYLIYGVNTEGTPVVLEDSDTDAYDKYNSSDYYALVTEGVTYKFVVCGRRSTRESRYQNIIHLEEVTGVEIEVPSVYGHYLE